MREAGRDLARGWWLSIPPAINANFLFRNGDFLGQLGFFGAYSFFPWRPKTWIARSCHVMLSGSINTPAIYAGPFVSK